MTQHPVPQNISSYEFRLVGDMTLKQFFQIAGGAAIALVFIRSPLPDLIKWPIAIVSGSTGLLLAFVPVQGRPFSQWLFAFFKAVYSPTEYLWKQAGSNPSVPPVSSSPSAPQTPLDKLETQLFSRITELFNSSFSSPKPKAEVAHTSPVPSSPSIPPTTLYTPKPPPPPSTASMFSPGPNIVSGIIQSSTGQSLEGVIVEITNTATGLPVRALRTNRLGQFQIATPLPNGDYSLTCEKDGLTFPITTLNPTGQPLPALIIKAT